MSAVLAITEDTDVQPAVNPAPAAPEGCPDELLRTAIAAACGRIAPLWPLASFVAVNPFLGFADRDFAATAATLRRVTGTGMLMPRAFYRDAIRAGEIGDADLAAALRRMPAVPGGPRDVEALRAAAAAPQAGRARPKAVVATVAEVLDRLASGDRHASRTAFMIDEISRWCAAYFDEGQAIWSMPGRALRPYHAWRRSMRHDRNPEAFGIRGFRAAVAAMPEDPVAAIGAVIDGLGIPGRAVEDYLFRALFDIGGWSAYVRRSGWNGGSAGAADDPLVDLMAIRLVWGYALFGDRTDEAFRTAWADAMRAAEALPLDDRLGDDPDLAVDLALHDAYETACQRRLLARFTAGRPDPAGSDGRKDVQAAFCIDVRSEVFRRALETTSDGVETIGFAGFFGFPIEYVPLGRTRGSARCPVLLAPSFMVCETVAGAAQAEADRIAGHRRNQGLFDRVWKAFRSSAVSSFTYVETMGLAFAAKIVGDSAGLTRTVPHPDAAGLDRAALDRIEPDLRPGTLGGRPTGFRPGQMVEAGAAVLKAMSLTGNFARIVLLVGHGSSTVNNPHAAGLDCGACGGHTGEANARVAAGILNDPRARAGLRDRGIDIPADTVFLPALHDTTTDEVRLYDVDRVPPQRRAELDRLRGWLGAAAALTRAERAARLGIGPSASPDRAVIARSRDWSEVRPEWGLAGNAAFVAAPRRTTAGRDFGGRVFLHSYDWRQDEGFRVLELIMTAPMVVASWINLQYFGSTVNNRAFGSGNKVLHNVVGTIGVLEGNGGDLRTGLPWQSVHDGSRFVHEPVRLSVFIDAPVEAIEGVIARHQGVRDLVENRWVHLFALDGDGPILGYAGNGNWEARSGA
jgi:uncharacterized protein YbcC (UPF0753/DUF2309 family)